MNIDTELQAIFGLTQQEIRRAENRHHDLPMAYFNVFCRIVDRSGAIEFIERTQQAQRKSNAGAKSLVPPRAVFIAMLINSYWGYGASYTELANTFMDRLTPEQLERLGVARLQNEPHKWYNRCRSAMFRAVKALDPWHATSKRCILNAEEYAEAERIKDVSRERYANEVLALLVRQSAELLPKKFLEPYRGDVAIDATLIPVGKKFNSPRKGLFLHVDFTAGIYGRSRGHYAKNAFGFEATTTVMIDTRQGEFPFPLVTGADVHKPGKIKESSANAFLQHHAFFPTAGVLTADRAYNNLKPHRFQAVARSRGFVTAYKYPKDDLGYQGKVTEHPVIMVDGNLYLQTMPQHLQDLHALVENRRPTLNGTIITPELYEQYFAERSKYRLKPHGRPDSAGYQRYTMPEHVDRLDHRDPATGVPCAPPEIPTRKIMVAPEPRIVRSIQHAEYKSEEWFRLTGQRNHVENSNRSLKRAGRTELDNPGKRLGRGKTFQTLAIGLAIAAENIRRIITGIVKLGKIATAQTRPAPKTRAKRRTHSAPETLACITATSAPPGS